MFSQLIKGAKSFAIKSSTVRKLSQSLDRWFCNRFPPLMNIYFLQASGHTLRMSFLTVNVNTLKTASMTWKAAWKLVLRSQSAQHSIIMLHLPIAFEENANFLFRPPTTTILTIMAIGFFPFLPQVATYKVVWLFIVRAARRPQPTKQPIGH